MLGSWGEWVCHVAVRRVEGSGVTVSDWERGPGDQVVLSLVVCSWIVGVLEGERKNTFARCSSSQ